MELGFLWWPSASTALSTAPITGSPGACRAVRGSVVGRGTILRSLMRPLPGANLHRPASSERKEVGPVPEEQGQDRMKLEKLKAYSNLIRAFTGLLKTIGEWFF